MVPASRHQVQQQRGVGLLMPQTARVNAEAGGSTPAAGFWESFNKNAGRMDDLFIATSCKSPVDWESSQV